MVIRECNNKKEGLGPFINNKYVLYDYISINSVEFIDLFFLEASLIDNIYFSFPKIGLYVIPGILDPGFSL